MSFFLKFIGVLLVITAVFGAGYLLGSHRLENLNRLLSNVKSEMGAKVSGLEKETHSLRIRVYLVTARDRLLSAQNNLKERNFGEAEKELASAKAELRTAAPMTSKETEAAITELEASIDGVIAIVRRSDPRAKVKLNEVKAELDRLIERS